MEQSHETSDSLGQKDQDHARKPRGRRGFALVAALLLLLLISGVAVAMLVMVNTETTAGNNDLQANIAFVAAQGAIEKMTSDLSSVFTSIQSPRNSDIQTVVNCTSTLPGVTFPNNTDGSSGCSLSAPVDANNNLVANWGIVTSGANQGLYAQIIPITFAVTAQSAMNNQVRMVRTAEIALIPAFQFGMFADGDLDFFSSPDMDFLGRVQTNADLYLGVSNGSALTFGDKLSAYGNVIRTQLPNGLSASSNNDGGDVWIPTAASGCAGTKPNCRKLASNEGSVTGGPTSGQNGSWPNISKTTYNGFIKDGNYGRTNGTGAKCLTLPFVGGGSQACPTGPGQPVVTTGAQPYELIRRPPAGEATTSAVSQARLYNNAEIRVLLSDDPAELGGGGATDAQNIRLANVQTNAFTPDYSSGVPAAVPTTLPALASGKPYVTYFAEASTAIQDSSQWTNAWTTNCLPSDFNILPQTKMATGSYTWPLLNVENAPVVVADPTAVIATTTATTLPGGTGGFANYPIRAPYISGLFTTGGASLLAPNCWATATQNAGVTQNKNNLSTTYAAASATTWNLIDGYIRVEYLGNDMAYHPITKEWLELGFARGITSPTGSVPNPVHPNAILIFQAPADRNGDGSLLLPNGVTATVGVPSTNATTTVPCNGLTGTGQPKCGIAMVPEVQLDAHTNTVYYGDDNDATSVTRNNWYPINFYDAREGEPRDVLQGNNSCTASGIMNAVELDVKNLKRWLAGSIGTNGPNVNATKSAGYILYYSDRRGMLPNPNKGNAKSGDSGLEDVVNQASTNGVPDGVLDTPGGIASPEDVNMNGLIDKFGPINLGLAFGLDQGGTLLNAGINPTSLPPNQFDRINNCQSTGRGNWVSGARHVLKVVDGSLGNVPTQPGGTGGFTVASENPVYVQGDYNSSASDPTWNSTTATEPAHAASAVIADAVTLLSNSWSDLNSFVFPTDANSRNATETYYRLAITAGRNKTFPSPSYSSGVNYGFGTDGGVHNFLRYLEDWSSTTAHYKGSIVTLYYSTYNTGTFKCCTYSVYKPPSDRDYRFDPLFSQPVNLPPGTPMFRDINSLSFRQDFSPN